MNSSSMAELRPMKDNMIMELKIHKTLFQWIKDSRWMNKCKRSIKRARQQLLLHTNRLKCIVRQSRADIAQLIRHNHNLHKAFVRVEKLHHDEGMLLVYIELDDYLVKIRNNLSKFARNVDDLSLEIHEAVSSILLAASFCGELAELRRMRDLFAQWFDNDFVRLTGNFVNCNIKHKLCERCVSDDVKLRLLSEISKEYSIKIGMFEVDKENVYEEDDSSARTIANQANELHSKQVSIIQDKNDQLVVTKLSLFHEVFRRMKSKFSLQARSSNLVTPHQDSCDNVLSLEETGANANSKGKHEANNIRASMYKGLCEERFIEWKDESNIDHEKVVIVGNNEESFIELKDKSIIDHEKVVVVASNSDKGDEEDEKSRLSYVHPKLPDYEDVLATFTKYKKERRLNNTKDIDIGVVTRWTPWSKFAC